MGCYILSTYNHLLVIGTVSVYHIILCTDCAVAEEKQFYGAAISVVEAFMH